MSRFKKLQEHLGFFKAVSFYSRIKRGRFEGLTVPGVTHPFTLRDNPYDYATFEEVLLQKTYDIDLPFTPKYIIDGGANIGLTACFFASKYPEAKIFSVEPDAENFSLLRSNCRAYKNIEVLQTGIWKNNAFLGIEDSGAGNNAFTVKETTANSGGIPAVSITGIMEKFSLPRIDILKLDIEGSEKEVFSEGFETWLPKTRLLIVELHDEMKAGCSGSVFNAVNRYDFTTYTKGENTIFMNKNFTT
jgi:FkbM family methyltransferase